MGSMEGLIFTLKQQVFQLNSEQNSEQNFQGEKIKAELKDIQMEMSEETETKNSNDTELGATGIAFSKCLT